jgi:hypothetical protein
MKSHIRKFFEIKFWKKKKTELMHVFNFTFKKKMLQLNAPIMTLNDIL